MRRRSPRLLVGLLAGLCAALGAGPAGAQTAYVRVEATGVVLVDGRPAGRGGEAVAVAAGRPVTVALVEDGGWDPRRAETTVTAAPGDTLAVALVLPDRVRIETLPIRADVTLESADGTARALGPAPVTVDLPAGTRGTVVARLAGYREARLALGPPGPGGGGPGAPAPLVLLLSPDGSRPGTAPVTVLTTEGPSRGRTLVDVGLGALTLAAGTVAVVAKFRADRLDDRYRDPTSPERGTESLRNEAQRLDLVSGVALGVMQVGVGALAFRLVLR